MVEKARDTLGLGVLSWHGYDTLRRSLQSYQREDGFLQLFDERVIFFPEITDEGREIATQFGFMAKGQSQNLGIMDGFKGLARALTSDIIVMVENDCPLIENKVEAERQLNRGRALIATGEVKVVRLRSRKDPGEAFDTVDKYNRFYGPDDAPLIEQVGKKVLRTLRRGKAKRLIGTSVYVEAEPDTKFPTYIRRTDDDCFLLPTSVMTWTNQSIMIGRKFFLDTIIARSEAVNGRRKVNGFKNLEIELNDRWWRTRGWTVGVTPGLFTHRRLGDRGY
ncbi:MAG: hypothetical protein ACRBCJ_11615 [Hyphomicrobiaceae bacterium]